MALHTDDTLYHLHGEADVYRGRGAVAEKFSTQLAQVPDICFELKSLYGGGDHFVFEAVITYSGKNGEKAIFDGVDVITIRDGLVVSRTVIWSRRRRIGGSTSFQAVIYCVTILKICHGPWIFPSDIKSVVRPRSEQAGRRLSLFYHDVIGICRRLQSQRMLP